MQMLPAPGQGALAVECRDRPTTDAASTRARPALDDPATRAAVTAERALLAALEAGCSAPVGALADVADGDDGPRSAGGPPARGRRSTLDGPRRPVRAVRHRPPLVERRPATRARPSTLAAAETARPQGAAEPDREHETSSEPPAPASHSRAGRRRRVRRRRPRRPGPADAARRRACSRAADVVVTDQPRPRGLLAAHVPRGRRGRSTASFGEDGQPLDPRRAAPSSSSTAARGGRRVVRLMAGDPATVHRPRRGGRGLRARRTCRSRSCPGVPSVTAVPAYAGIPLTASRAPRASPSCTPHGAEVDWSPLRRHGRHARAARRASRTCSPPSRGAARAPGGRRRRRSR